MNILVHTSFIGPTGYNNHARSFFCALNKYHTVKVRNFTIGETWKGMSNTPHDNEPYITQEMKNMLILQTLHNSDGGRSDYPMYDYKGDFKPDVHIILNESDHYYFYENYEGYKIGYCVYESTRFPEHFFKRLFYFDEMWVPTQWQFDSLVEQGYPKEKIRIVPEGVDVDVFKPKEKIKKRNKFRFLLFGRWDYRKSTTEIIRTFGETFKNNDKVELLCSVENPYPHDGLKSTEERIKKNNLEYKNIRYVKFPKRSDYINYLQEGEVFVSCARSEGWNLPLIEAMSCGTPSIYSNWGAQLQFAKNKGIPVKISHLRPANIYDKQVEGEYCEPDFNHLAEQMKAVYENYEIYKINALKESEIIHKEFNWDKVASNASKILNNISNGKKIKMNTLDLIAKSYGTDKSSEFHDYCRKYEKYLPFKRYDNLNILEIGVFNGASVKTWKDYFYRSNILGIDIDPNCKKYEENRITIEIGSQTDEKFLKGISERYGPFDMILDDGSHMNSHIIYSFNHLFESIKSGGIYIIEDTHTSYWPEYDGGLGRENSSVEYFKAIIDEVNFFGEKIIDMGCPARDELLLERFKQKKYDFIGTSIETIMFLHSIIIIVKR